jgi:hypothetical protein
MALLDVVLCEAIEFAEARVCRWERGALAATRLRAGTPMRRG